jgi:hypothetical protein
MHTYKQFGEGLKLFTILLPLLGQKSVLTSPVAVEEHMGSGGQTLSTLAQQNWVTSLVELDYSHSPLNRDSLPGMTSDCSRSLVFLQTVVEVAQKMGLWAHMTAQMMRSALAFLRILVLVTLSLFDSSSSIASTSSR